MTISRHPVARAGVLTLAALALAACGESTSPLNVSPAQLESMGESVASEIEAGVQGLTAQDVMSSTGGAPSFSRVPRSSGLLTHSPVFSRIGSSVAADYECGVLSQNPPIDTDGDLVPDNVSVTFALPACHFADQTTSIDVTGVLRVSDPQPETAGLALSFGLENFRIGFAGSEGSGSVTRDGSASVSASETGLSQTMYWNDAAQLTGVPSVSANTNWTASFVVAQGQTITAGNPLPDGAYQANGSVGYREGNRVASFSVTTITPLQYSASCAAGIAQGTSITPFSAGRVRVAITSSGGSGYVDVTYSSCNSATVIFAGQ
jgi:hypothetical protein